MLTKLTDAQYLNIINSLLEIIMNENDDITTEAEEVMRAAGYSNEELESFGFDLSYMEDEDRLEEEEAEWEAEREARMAARSAMGTGEMIFE